jgi:hypothetical protein
MVKSNSSKRVGKNGIGIKKLELIKFDVELELTK